MISLRDRPSRRSIAGPSLGQGVGATAWAAARAVLLVALLLAPAGCLTSDQVQTSIWPPKDFHLDVRSSSVSPLGVVTDLQRFTVFADGFAAYREAEAPPPGQDQSWPPLFGTVAAWRMRPESTRILARMLAGTGLADQPEEQGELQEGETRSLAVQVTWFEDSRLVVVRGRAYGPVYRLIHVLNAFLPEGKEFWLPEIQGDPEPRRLARVPAPARSLADARELQAELLRRRPDDPELWLEEFALAQAQGDRAGAVKAYDELAARAARLRRDTLMLRSAEAVLAELRELLAAPDGAPASRPR
ncbi:MAG: hypothetical protein IT458_16845 [Planctomycetes bacterium]|nr:hypothetical protein [Planctomycetota bacterium]